MLEIPIKTKFDGVETDVVVTVRGFQVLHADDGEARVVLDDYDVAYESGVTVPAEVLGGNDTLALAIEELIEECVVPGAAPEAISPEEDVAAKLGKSAGVIDGIVEIFTGLPVLARPVDYDFQLDNLALVKGALLDGQNLIHQELLGLPPVPAAKGPLIKLPVQAHLH